MSLDVKVIVGGQLELGENWDFAEHICKVIRDEVEKKGEATPGASVSISRPETVRVTRSDAEDGHPVSSGKSLEQHCFIHLRT